jgi:4,5:9,10-diseco-3-hydroxy-5,9,17-trioxoandrosta-1(10),2-diene-4-oate hydrolase
MRTVAARQRLLSGLHVSERQISVAGRSTTLLEGGNGPVLILLHGGIECGGAYWAPVIASLARSHRLVIPDVPGLGESEPGPRLNAAFFCEWFGALLTEAATPSEQPTLLAHSLVGSLAARFAANTTEQLQSLVLYGVPGIGPFRMPVGLMLASVRFGLRPNEASFERFLPWAFLDTGRTRGLDPEWFDAFSAYMVARGSVPHVKRTMRQLVAAGKKRVGDDELRQIDIPTALLWGERDRMAPLSLAKDTSGRLAWPLHIVREAGHVPHIEQPLAFVEVLQAAIRSGASTPS